MIPPERIFRSLLFTFLFLSHALFVPPPLPCAETKEENLPITQPVTFSGDLLEASRKEGKITLRGNAYARHGSTEIHAETIEILYDNDKQTVREVRASEKVRLVEPNRRGRSERARYLPSSRLLILEGSPTLWEGEDELQGERIFVYRDPDRVVVEKARATVSPERLKRMNPPTPATSPGSNDPQR
jgi:lipopolysaccharide export system protein LptA